jgi:hypothetical protein
MENEAVARMRYTHRLLPYVTAETNTTALDARPIAVVAQIGRDAM